MKAHLNIAVIVVLDKGVVEAVVREVVEELVVKKGKGLGWFLIPRSCSNKRNTILIPHVY
jgi:hypothetical protein